MRAVLTGSSAARGMSLGRARLEHPSRQAIDDHRLEPDEIADELARLYAALATAREELNALRSKLTGALARDVGEFIDAHRLILSDQELIGSIVSLVRDQRFRASSALRMQSDRLVAVFDAMEDPYLRSRKEDFEHVIGRVQAVLARPTSEAERKLASRVGEILVSDTVAPSELVPLMEHGVLGVVLASGSTLSHSAILARSMHLPMVVGVSDALSSINDDDLILIDGERGQLIVHPTAQDLARYSRWQREQIQLGKRLALLANAETRTADGHEICLFANAEMPADVAHARSLGAAGIGLYRTEFMFMQRRELPSEEEQFLAYRDLVLGMAGLPVTIRTLDLGADKSAESGLGNDSEANPALGVRGVRLTLRRPQLMATQMRAILRASAFGKVRILVPMITTLAEVISVRNLQVACTRDLRAEGISVAERVELGAMIEVPAAAIALQGMIRDLDFIAIGTNDLVQYTLATDRNNTELGDLYDPLHPAVLKLIALIIRAARGADRRVTLCGEIAGAVEYTALLLALGLTDLSMHPGVILEVRERIGRLDMASLRKMAPSLLRAPSGDRVRELLARIPLR